MHAAYCQVCPGEPPLNDNRSLGKQWDQRRDRWAQLVAAGYSLEQLRFVLEYLSEKVKRKGWDDRCLALRNITDPDRFQEHLTLMRGIAKATGVRDLPPAARVLAQFRKMAPAEKAVDVKTSMRMVPELLKQMRASVDGGGK